MKKIFLLMGLICLTLISCSTSSASGTLEQNAAVLKHEKLADDLQIYWADKKINLMASLIMSAGQVVELEDVGVVFTHDDFMAIISTEIRVGKDKEYAGTANTIFTYAEQGWSLAGLVIKPAPAKTTSLQ